MGWDKRGYYYKTERVGGKVTTRYFGRNPIIAELDRERREEKLEEQAAINAHRDEQARLLREDQSRWQATHTLLTLTLEAWGFTRYSRNPWKRRRMNEIQTIDNADNTALRKQFRSLVKRVVRGDADAVRELQAFSMAHPKEMARSVVFNVDKLAMQTLASTEYTQDGSWAEQFYAKMECVAFELAGENPTVPRLLCAQAAAFAWAEHWRQSMLSAATRGGERSKEQIRRQDAAHKRLMVSLRTLSQIAKAEAAIPRMPDAFASFTFPTQQLTA
jgi:hypothetical protein